MVFLLALPDMQGLFECGVASDRANTVIISL
jgi:hypothetical protein